MQELNEGRGVLVMRKGLLCLLISVLLLVTACGGDNTSKKEELDDDNNSNENTDEEAYESIIHKSNHLGFDILEILDEKAENVFISPISLYMALAMLYPGAEGDTKAEMAELLSVGDMSTDTFNEGNAALLKKIKDKDQEDTKLHLANSLWLDEQYELANDYEHSIEAYFHGKVSSIDSSDDAAADAMNDWVKEQTNDKIENIVAAPLDENFVAMLMNTVYFNGKWTYPFEPELTEEAIFHKQDGEESTAAFMNVKEDFQYVKADAYEGVRLPYGEEGQLSMYAYLPNEHSNMTSIHEAIIEKGLHGMMDEMEEKAGSVSLPKFKLEYEQEMNEMLQKLGMVAAFDEDLAEFPHIITSADPLHISEVKHMTYLDVTEAGTEAAGSTNVGITTMSAPMDDPFELIFDHPFFMLIIDEETETILFMGYMYDVS